MSYFIFTVEIPPIPRTDINTDEAPAWVKFKQDTRDITQGIETMASNVWIIPAKNSLSVLTGITNAAIDNKLPYSCAIIAEAPLFLANTTGKNTTKGMQVSDQALEEMRNSRSRQSTF